MWNRTKIYKKYYIIHPQIYFFVIKCAFLFWSRLLIFSIHLDSWNLLDQLFTVRSTSKIILIFFSCFDPKCTRFGVRILTTLFTLSTHTHSKEIWISWTLYIEMSNYTFPIVHKNNSWCQSLSTGWYGVICQHFYIHIYYCP